LAKSAFSQNPCNSIIPLTCGSSTSYTLPTGNGSWSPPTGSWWTTPGNEQVFSYTPASSGPFTINITNNNYYVDLFLSTSCGSLGWTYIDDIYTTANNAVILTGGVTYYFLIDDENTIASSGNITISCPPPSAPPCSTSIPAANTCGNATPICDFNGYCGNTSSSYTVNTWSNLTTEFCGSIENNSFFSFVAGSAVVSLDVWVNNCTNNDGIQFMIFSSSGNCSGIVTNYMCENHMYPGYSSISSSGLTIGNTYYLMVDGWAGDVCDYVIGANSTSGILLPVSLNTNAVSICIGASTTFTASGGDGTYSWAPSLGLNIASGSTVIATPAVTTTYTVSSNAGNSLCPTASTEQVTVLVDSPSISDAGLDARICAYDSYTVSGALASSYSSISWTSNGTGTFTAANTLNPVYTPSSADIGVGSVTLTLTAIGNGACGNATSDMQLTIYPLPVAGPIWHN
jgi:hypothetical protein